MKNVLKFALVSFITGLSVFLISCSDSDGQVANTSSLNQPKTEQEQQKPPYYIISNTSGYGSNNTGNSLGFFTVERDSENSAHVEFLDLETKQRIFLSNQINVTFDEQNPGWIDDIDPGATPMVTEDYLFLISSRDFFLERKEKIIKMDLNGGNRKTVEVDGFINPYGVITDGDEIYFTMLMSGQDGRSLGESLYKSDFDNGTVTELCKVSNAEEYSNIMSVTDDKMFFRVFRETETEISSEIFSYDISDNEYKSTDFSFMVNDIANDRTMVTFYKLYQDEIFYMQAPEYDLKARNLLTGEEKIIANFKDRFTLPYSRPDFTQNVYDGKLMVGIENGNDISDGFVYDVETGEIFDFELFRESPFMSAELGQEPVRILASAGDYYLVHSRVETFVREFIDGEHEIRDHVEGLILKEDYWNNNPNFIDIEDTTLS